MIIYAEQVRHFYDGRTTNFEIAIFCNGTYTFKPTNAQTGEVITTIRALDVSFVHAMVAYMKGAKTNEHPPHFPIIEITPTAKTEPA